MANWQPIQTAPKDGTECIIIFCVADQFVIHLAFYRGQEEWKTSGQYCGFCETYEEWEGWWSYKTGSISQEKLDGIYTPTHWIPYTRP